MENAFNQWRLTQTFYTLHSVISLYGISVLCLLCFRTRLFIDILWSPAEKGLTSWFSFVMSNCVFVTFPCGILGQVWYLIVSIRDICPLSYVI